MKPEAPARIAEAMMRFSASEETTTIGTSAAAVFRRIRPSMPFTSGRFRSSTTTSGRGVSPISSIARSSRPAVTIVSTFSADLSVMDSASQNKGWSSTTRAQ